MGDFAENFTFVMQDEVQSYHWNNAQATIHPLVCYWLENVCQSMWHVLLSLPDT